MNAGNSPLQPYSRMPDRFTDESTMKTALSLPAIHITYVHANSSGVTILDSVAASSSGALSDHTDLDSSDGYS
jgi:hypothetical protein